jgi:hypothetical protein
MFGVGGDPYPGIPGIGSFIDAARWDGSDFFIADNNNEILIVNATAKRLQELSLHNVVLEEAGLESVRPIEDGEAGRVKPVTVPERTSDWRARPGLLPALQPSVAHSAAPVRPCP